MSSCFFVFCPQTKNMKKFFFFINMSDEKMKPIGWFASLVLGTKTGKEPPISSRSRPHTLWLQSSILQLFIKSQLFEHRGMITPLLILDFYWWDLCGDIADENDCHGWSQLIINHQYHYNWLPQLVRHVWWLEDI